MIKRLKNYYAILEVPVGCSLEEIRQAYHRLVQTHLDDEVAFADLKEAYEALTTPTRRAEYDKAAWGESFDPAQSAALPVQDGLAGRCPMGPESQCPVVLGRALSGDKFCPDCGYTLSGLTAETAFDTAALPDPARQARLEDRAGQVHSLRAGSNSVGREGADVLVFDKTVSRSHAQLELADDGSVSVEDLSSTNGTQVNNERLMPHVSRRLVDGDQVQFGSVSLTLRLPESVQAKALPPSAADPSAPAHVRAQVRENREGSLGVYPLKQGVTTFGRRPENMVVLTGDLYVSGSHAQISGDGDTFILTDIGSTNGTLLNGERLAINTPVTLDSGDVVVIGATGLCFERLGPGGEVLDAEREEDYEKDYEKQTEAVPEEKIASETAEG